MSRKRRGRGEGGISQRADGRWEARISLGFTDSGKRRRRTVYGATKAEVQNKLRELQNRLGNGTLIAEGPSMTVSQYLDHWLNGPAKEKVAKTTWGRYEQLVRLRLKPLIGGTRLVRLGALEIEQMVAELRDKGVSARGRQMAVNVLSAALKHATQVRPPLIPYNPVASVTKPKPTKPVICPLSADEVRRFLKAALNDRLFALFVLAIDTGMRAGELFGLEWADIDLGTGSVMVQRALKELKGKVWLENLKTEKSRRRIEISATSIAALKRHRDQQSKEGLVTSRVFCGADGGFLRRPNVAQRHLQPILRRAELPKRRFHDLRHTSATLLLLSNERTKVVSERLGHASTTTTESVYQHVCPTMQKQAAEKMDRILSDLVQDGIAS